MALKTSLRFSVSFLFSLLLFQATFAQGTAKREPDGAVTAAKLNQAILEKPAEPLNGINPSLAATPGSPQ